MIDEFDEPDTFINFIVDTTLCRLIENSMVPSKLTIKLGIDIVSDSNEDINFALLKTKHWLENYVSRSIAVSCMNADGFKLLLDEDNKPRLDNPLMVVPMEPTDHHLLFIFQSKIRALADNVFDVVTIEIASSDSQGLTFTFVGDEQGELPSMEDWIPGPNWFTVPWWNRNDVSMIDTVAPEGCDFGVKPSWAATLDFLRPSFQEQTAIVINGDWEPRILDDDDKK